MRQFISVNAASMSDGLTVQEFCLNAREVCISATALDVGIRVEAFHKPESYLQKGKLVSVLN
jgi:hypothetical protein